MIESQETLTERNKFKVSVLKAKPIAIKIHNKMCALAETNNLSQQKSDTFPFVSAKYKT